MTARSDSGNKDAGGSEKFEETLSAHSSFEKNDVSNNQAVVESQNLPEGTSLEVEEDQVIVCALWFISVML